MSEPLQPGGATCAASECDPLCRAKRRADALDKPARALGPKRAALQARRGRVLVGGALAHHRDPGTPHADILVASDDAVLAFAVFALRHGMLVRRICCPPQGPRIVQVMKFDRTDRFDQWCSRDPLLVEHRRLFDELLRRCHELIRCPT